MSTKTSITLPQLRSGLFLTDGGIETSLIFFDGLDLPYFAAFHLLRDKTGRDALVRYYERYIAIAQADGVGFILESPTWRASSDWGSKLGYPRDAIGAVNRESIELMHELKARHAHRTTPIVVSGCVGPRGDGYDTGQVMSPTEAAAYHAHQIGVFADAKAYMTTAITMTNASEAIGFVHAAAHEVNCAHPTHFERVMSADEEWTRRIRGLRANASRRSHQELNDAPDLDVGDPIELANQYRGLLRRHPQITVLGGCCGTDHRHIQSISKACRRASMSG
jgi:homocysteine S-methyltransferase